MPRLPHTQETIPRRGEAGLSSGSRSRSGSRSGVGVLGVVVGMGLLGLLMACARFAAGDSAGSSSTSDGGNGGGTSSGSSGGGDNDGGLEGDAFATKDCDASFCSSFDPPDMAPLWRWDRSTDELTDGSVPKIVLGAGQSPPFALTVFADPNLPPPQPSQFVEKDIPNTQAFTLDFAFRVDQTPEESTDAINFIQILCNRTNEIQRTKLSRVRQINIAADGATQTPVGPTLMVGSWNPIRLTFDPTVVRLTRLDLNENNTETIQVPSCPSAKFSVRLGGMLDTDDAVPGIWKLSFDNVRISF